MALRRKTRVIAAVVAAAAIVVLGARPVTTRYGVNYRWSSKRIPLFEKAVNFVSRDLQLRRLAAEVGAGPSSAEGKVMRLFDWVILNVRPTPSGFPVVDDHVLHILVRGYGAPDQRAEALAVLASYNGMPATAAAVSPGPGRAKLVLTLVKVDTRIAVFDVMHELAFRKPTGELADLSDLVREPSLATNPARGIVLKGVPYEQYVAKFRDLRPVFSRMEHQKLWPRLKFEAGRWLHVSGQNN